MGLKAEMKAERQLDAIGDEGEGDDRQLERMQKMAAQCRRLGRAQFFSFYRDFLFLPSRFPFFSFFSCDLSEYSRLKVSGRVVLPVSIGLKDTYVPTERTERNRTAVPINLRSNAPTWVV